MYPPSYQTICQKLESNTLKFALSHIGLLGYYELGYITAPHFTDNMKNIIQHFSNKFGQEWQTFSHGTHAS